MSKGLRVNIRSPRELMLLKEISKGNLGFGELTQEEKHIVYTSNFDLQGVVDPEALHEYEQKLGLFAGRSDDMRVRLLVRSFTEGLKRRLPS